MFRKKIIIEIDGKIHEKQIEYDKMREEDIKNMGYKIIRFTNEEVLKHWDIVSNKLKKIIENK